MNKRVLITIAAALMATASLKAQVSLPHTDSSQASGRWAVEIGAGMSGNSGSSKAAFNKTSPAPDVSYAVGVKYKLKPLFRLGANISYMRSQNMSEAVASTHESIPGTLIMDKYPTTLERYKDVVQNMHDLNMVAVSANADYSVLRHLCYKAPSALNIWMGLGLGTVIGNNRHTLTTSVHEEAVYKTDTQYNVYNHSWIESEHKSNTFAAMYVPLNMSVEYDLLPQLTVGVTANYAFHFFGGSHNPKGTYNFGAVVRYNL